MVLSDCRLYPSGRIHAIGRDRLAAAVWSVSCASPGKVAYLRQNRVEWFRLHNVDPLPILAFNDPVHDSSFCMYEERGIVHIETERFSRMKYDTQNPIISFCELFPERVGRFPIIALEDGHHVAPLV